MLIQNKQEKEFLKIVNLKLYKLLNKKSKILPKSYELINNACKHLCLTEKAKKIRPLLSYYFSKTINLSSHKIINAAVAAELIHCASLMHDDVLDASDLRRGKKSVNNKWNNSIAVLGGNFLLSIALNLLQEYPVSSIKFAIELISHMSVAAVAEIKLRGQINENFEIWKNIALGKTGKLFAWIGFTIALIAFNKKASPKLLNCGKHIGIAFQLADDLKDLKQNNTLKTRFSDIINKELSYPILLACKNHPIIKNAIKRLWKQTIILPKQAEKIGILILQTTIKDKIYNIINSEINLAIKSLGSLSKTTGGIKIKLWLKYLYESIHII